MHALDATGDFVSHVTSKSLKRSQKCTLLATPEHAMAPSIVFRNQHPCRNLARAHETPASFLVRYNAKLTVSVAIVAAQTPSVAT